MKEIEDQAKRFGVNVILKESYLLENDIHILSISVNPQNRRRGLFNKFIEKMISLSENTGRTLTLEASSESESSEWLVCYYKSKGFEYSDQGYGDYGAYMEYTPESIEESLGFTQTQKVFQDVMILLRERM